MQLFLMNGWILCTVAWMGIVNVSGSGAMGAAAGNERHGWSHDPYDPVNSYRPIHSDCIECERTISEHRGGWRGGGEPNGPRRTREEWIEFIIDLEQRSVNDPFADQLVRRSGNMFIGWTRQLDKQKKNR